MALGLKVVCVWNLSCSSRHRTFPEGRGHEPPPSPCELVARVSPDGQFVVTENVHKAAALFDAHLRFLDFPVGSDGKASVYNVRDMGSIPGLGRFPGEGNHNPFQYSCLENPMDGGA